MTIEQLIIIIGGMTLSLAVGFFWGFSYAFSKVDEVLAEFKDE
jgi:hypothetical protein